MCRWLLLLSLAAGGCVEELSPPPPRPPPALAFYIGNSDGPPPTTARLHDTFEDADVRVELSVDERNLRRVTMDVTNKTGSPIGILWSQSTSASCSCFGGCPADPQPRSDPPCARVEPGAHTTGRIKLASPLEESPAPRLLRVPMIVRGVALVNEYELMVRTLE